MNSVASFDQTKKIVHLKLIGISWLAVVGFDFFLHAGLLAHLYQGDNPGILPPLDAFYRIPIGYFAFLFNIALVYFIIIKIDVNDRKEIIKLIMTIGIVLSLSSTLAQFSILQVNPLLLFGWGLGQMLQFTLMGVIIGFGYTGYSQKKLFICVFIFVFLVIVFTIIMQNIGLSPPWKYHK